jgi:hypothetical protein
VLVVDLTGLVLRGLVGGRNLGLALLGQLRFRH